MASDLSSLLASSKALTSHLARPDLPSVHLSLDQVEAQSRRLVSRQPGTSKDTDRANYLLAQAHVDASALSSSIAHLNTATTFSPLQPLQDTDVAGYLRYAHEQNLIATIDEGRKGTQEEFYRVLEERSLKDWEAKKKRVFEELGGRVGSENKALVEFKKSTYGRSNLMASTSGPVTLQMQNKMMIYDQVVMSMNSARLCGSSFPIVHALIEASIDVHPDTRSVYMTQLFRTLAKITSEPPALPPVEHAGAHILNAPILERQFAKSYLGPPDSRESIALRKAIAKGARESLEEQYWDVIERTIQSRPMEARLGGDPSVGNKIRAYLLMRHYQNGEWADHIELIAGQPLWARLYLLVRTGHVREAALEADQYSQAIEHRELGFVNHFKTWLDSPERRLPKPQRDHLQSVYNAHMLYAATADPFKLALYKLMGKLEPSRRSVQHITTTTEDWLWFQLAMVDEDVDGGLRGLSEVLLGYGERHFDSQNKGIWAGVLLMCGQFERAVAALWEHSETEIEAVHLTIALAYHGLLRVPSRAETSDLTPLSISPINPPGLNLSMLIWRYIRPFVKMDAAEALQYVYCICLSADQGDGVGQEQVESAWEQVRRIIVLVHSGAAWEELVGGVRPDGSRYSGVIEHAAPLLKLQDTKQFNEQILIKAANYSQENDRFIEAVKLYNLAGEYSTVISCLAQALGNTIAQPSAQGEEGRLIERTAADILRNYERTNRAVGKDREAVIRLLKIREAMDAKSSGRFDLALDIIESTDLIPLDGDVAKITRRAEEFKSLHDALQRNLPAYLTLAMETLVGVHHGVKSGRVDQSGRHSMLNMLRKKSRSLMIFAGMLKYRMSPDVYAYLARFDVEISL